jgi:two-component system cell cycle sensor histidine kinase/response regulator CckA
MISEIQQPEMRVEGKGSALSDSPAVKIIIVDDDPVLKGILVEALSAQGFEVTGCSSGSQALEELRQKEFDLLLTDLMMPKMDGIELLEAALKIDPQLLGIMMTGQGTIQTAVDAMKLGAFDYVLKPFRLQILMPVLTRAINARRLRMENLQLRETVAIYNLCQTITFTLEPQAVLSKLADAAVQQSDADEVSILLPTSDGKELYVAAVRGNKRERLLGERIPLEQSISSWVARERTPLILNGEVSDERFVALWPRSEVHSAVSVPMQLANKLVGVINLNMTNRLRPFTLGQMKALAILASTAAAALESASLYSQVEKAEKNYRSIFENAVEGIFQSTAKGRFIKVNPALAQILGYASGEEAIDQITDIAQQIYVDPLFATKLEVLQKDQDVLHAVEVEAYRKDGEKIWLSLNRRTIRDNDGTEIYHEGSVEDITKRKRAEKALQASESRKDAILKSALDCVITIDHEGNIVDFNPAAEQTFGYTREDVVGKRMADLIVPPALRANHDQGFASYLATGRSSMLGKRFETRAIHANGSELAVELTITAIGELPQPTFTAFIRDLTERERAEDEQARLIAEIKRQTERLNTIVATVPGVVFEVMGTPGAPNNKTNFVSEYIGPMLGYTVSEWLSVAGFWLSIVHPDDRQRVGQAAAADFAENKNGEHEFRWLGKDGRIVWVQAHTIVVHDEEGKCVGVRGVVTDITERKRVEEMQARRETHALFRADVGAALAVSRAPLRVTLELCAEAMVKHLHAAFARVWTLNRAENVLELQASSGIYTHIDGAHARVPLGKFKIGKIAQERLPHITSDVQNDPRVSDHEWARREKMVAFAGYPLLVEDRLLGVMAMFSREKLTEDTLDALASVADVVSQGIERKRAELALRESEECYRDLVENAHDIIYEHDLKGNYTSTNKAGEVITGYTLEETLQLNMAQTVAPEYLAKAQEMFRRKVAGEKTTAYELEIISKQGKRVAVEVNTRLVYHNGLPVGVQGIARDVTERKQLEEQLRQSQKLEAIGQLAGGVAHDFNNLLTVIGGYSSMLLRKFRKDSPHRSGLEEIQKASDRASVLTRQLLAFSRKQMLRPKILDLNLVVTDMDKMARRLIGEDIDLLTITSPVLGRVKADPGQIEQVLLNLIVNARDAMPKGGKLTIETRNIVHSAEYGIRHAAQAGPYVMLAVSDTGCGIDPAIQPRVFEPFFTTKPSGKGTGLGLATVYGIVKQSGGNIWVYSEVGRGTTFKIYLPRVDDSEDENEAIAGAIPQGTELVLLVEDEEQVRKILHQILSELGYCVLAASNGQEALLISEDLERDINLMIIDVVMPHMSGRELAERVQLLWPTLPVIFMSGYTDDAIVRHGLLDEKLHFIQKPFDSATVARKVREALDYHP